MSLFSAKKSWLVQVDASAMGIGAILTGGESGKEQAILHLSQKKYPWKYSTIEKECLEIKWALDTNITYSAENLTLTLTTEHLPGYSQWRSEDTYGWDSWVTWWYLSLQPFKFDIWHKAGRQNVMSDYISWLLHIVNPGEDTSIFTIWPKVCGSLSIKSICEPSPNRS